MNIEAFVDLSSASLAFAAVVVLVASFARGYLGFGFSSIFMVGLLGFIPASQLVPLSVALEILASISQAPRILPDVHRRYLAILLSASVFGVPGGVYLLTVFPEQWLRLTVYGVISVCTLVILIIKPPPVRLAFPNLLIAGLVAGAVNGATALSGLVLALFFASSAMTSTTMRATMIAYLFFTDIVTAGFLFFADHYDALTIFRVALAGPFMFLGVWLGTRQFLKTPSNAFKSAVRWLLLGFCAFGVLQMF